MNPSNFHAKIKINIFAIFVGLITGLVSEVFNYIISHGVNIMAKIYENDIYIFIIPLVAALLIAFIRNRLLVDKNQGFGVSQVMYEIEYIKTLVMKPVDVFYKILGTFVSIIAGFSVGRQGPIVHLGGAIGSNVAYKFKLVDDDSRVLIGCGVAGCLAGVFNSPIFATLFVVEILFKKRYFDMISTILVSAITSTLIVRLFQDESFFDIFITNYHYEMSEAPYFILLGVIMSLFAIAYVFALRFSKKTFNRLNLPIYVKTLIGALTISIALYFFKDIYYYGSSASWLLDHSYTVTHLIIIAISYIFLTAVSLGSGAIGGIFAPGLFIGLTAGLGIGQLFEFLKFPVSDPKTYAIAGMAAMYAGFATAPLSSTLMIAELTGQYNLIFPVLLSTLIASTLSEFVSQESIYHKDLKDLLHQ